MTLTAHTRRTATAIGIAAAALALPQVAHAQALPPITDAEIQSLPPELQSGPITEDFSETSIDADGVETITRTRRIESRYPATVEYADQGSQAGYAPAAYPHAGYTQAYAPGAAVFQREQWIDECERRTNGRGDREKGGIIGSLLGAITGGIIGNRVADTERLGGTLIGAGVGGLGGLLLGNLIGGGRDRDGDYDCAAALDSYLSQYGQPGVPAARIASRTIPAPVYQAPAYPVYAQPVQYAPAYTYAPPQQVVYVPIEYQQQQRVIVRETVREEVIPGAARTIPAPIPIKQPTAAPRYIKGN